jgi:hypothetical protein
MDPWSYVLREWHGYVTPNARLVFLIGRALDSVLFTRLAAAAVVAIVAMFLASERLAPAIPDRRVRLLFALSLAFLPVVGPYRGPLNDQWFVAIGLVGMALTTERRWWDYPLVFVGSLSGVAACLSWPTFRDPRGLVVLGVSIVMAGLIVVSDRRPSDPTMSTTVATIVVGVVLGMFSPQLPLRTRLSFGYLALVTIGLGALTGPGEGAGTRYLTAGLAFIALVIAAHVVPALDWVMHPRRASRTRSSR